MEIGQNTIIKIHLTENKYINRFNYCWQYAEHK